jgi:hypothetical protein
MHTSDERGRQPYLRPLSAHNDALSQHKLRLARFGIMSIISRINAAKA